MQVLLVVAAVAIIAALVLAIVGMKKDSKQKKEEAKRTYKTMNVLAVIGMISLGIGIFGPKVVGESNKPEEVTTPLIEIDETPDFTAQKLTEVEKEMLTAYHENFATTSWYRKELTVLISKWDDDYYKLSLFTEMPVSEENKKTASQLATPFFGMANEKGSTLQGRLHVIEVYGKENELLQAVKNPIAN